MAASVLLPQNVKPKKYKLHVEPNFETFKFAGKVIVDLDVLETTDVIQFHAENLEIQKATLSAGGKEHCAGEFGVPTVTMDKERHMAVLKLEQQLPPGPAVLTIDYSGVHNDNMIGFYRASYKRDGETKWLVTTQFEPCGARQALPCWDEPALKAKFEVSITVPPGLQGISNMPVTNTETRPDGSSVLSFAESPVMSTYLLAFVVGEFEKVSTTTPAGTEVNVYTTPGRKSQGEFALQVAAKILTFFADFFGIPYPLPKSDLIGIPDFAAGAMENWGLITFREVALLVDPDNAPAATRQRVAYVVSHELAHQWFGNLVTMRWWTDLWLNEGFATWVGHKGVDHVYPEWDEWTQFVSQDQVTAMMTDALLKSHPVEVPINDPKEIEQVFDALSYYKGACVIRQLEAAIGAESFKQGLHSYLTTHQYANTVTTDLWAALEEASGKPVGRMMHGWTKQMGYPLVTVSEPGEGQRGLTLRQTRFLSSGPPTPEEDSQLWHVSVSASTGHPDSAASPTPLPTFELTGKEGHAEEFVVPEGGWIRLNAGQTGIFRVNYTPHLWAALAAAVEKMALPIVDRLGLLIDAFALAKAGVIPASQALDLGLAFKNETQYTVWSTLAGDLGEIDILVSALGERKLLEGVGLELFRPIAEQLGWEPKPGESHLDAMLRPLVLGRLASYKDGPTVDKCAELFEAMQTEGLHTVPPDLRRVVISTAVKHGDRAELQAAKKMYLEAATPDFKVHCLLAMGATQNLGLYKEYLDWALDEANVKAQDQLYVFRAMSAHNATKEFAWAYFREHFEAIHKRFVSSPAVYRYIPAAPLKEFASASVVEEAEEFYAANPVPEGAMDLQRTLEAVRSRAAWLERDGANIVAWLRAKAPSA